MTIVVSKFLGKLLLKKNMHSTALIVLTFLVGRPTQARLLKCFPECCVGTDVIRAQGNAKSNSL